jgi:RNA polymerase sigma factor (sigma-70 family)
MTTDTFQALLDRVRAGDAEAIADLLRGHEPAVRRLVRLGLTDPRLRRVLDSTDVCQVVLANFLVRAAEGQFDLRCPDELRRLLGTMTRNALRNCVRIHHAECRDARRLDAGGDAALATVADPGADPGEVVAERELLEQAQRLLSPEERALAEQRAAGRAWADLAEEHGTSPEALRKQLARARGRVLRRLGAEGVRHA